MRLLRTRIKLLLLAICILPCLLFIKNNKNTQIKLTRSDGPDFFLQITRKEKNQLDYLFKKLVLLDSASYTILGNKPLSLGAYIIPFARSNFYLFCQSLTPRNLKTYFSWKTWKKYEHHFQNPNYMIWSEENPWVEGVILILTVNKENFSQVVNQHIQLFQTTLKQENVSAKDLLFKGSQGTLLSKELQSHEGLLGIVLGYGEQNAWLYFERSQGDNISLLPVWNLEEEQIASGSMGGFPYFPNNKNLSQYLLYPMFVAKKNSCESQALREEYRQTRGEILDYYQNKDFLEATLSLLL